jgi:hypothetical protein
MNSPRICLAENRLRHSVLPRDAADKRGWRCPFSLRWLSKREHGTAPPCGGRPWREGSRGF